MTLHLYSPPSAAATTSNSNKHGLNNTQDSHDANKRRKKTVCRRIPCKARGLSNDHNTDTAYFDVPLEAPHGLLLSCSHPECQDSGRRFRYCQVCALPVAKRNFLKRHGHGLIKTNKELKRDVDRPASCQFIYQDDEDATSTTMPFCLPTLDSLYSRQDAENKAASPPPVVSKPTEHRRVVSFDGSKQQAPTTPAAAAVPQASYVTDSSGTDSSIASSSDNEQPTDDLDQEFSDTTSGLTHDEKEWLSALYKQPDANDPTCMATWMANMTEWMDKVVPAAQTQEQAQTTSMDTVSFHVPNPLSVPNPLGQPPVTVSSYSPPTATSSCFMQPPVPVTPPLVPRQVMSSAPCQHAMVPPVPLASPGKCITETDFMAAIDGVDFSKVFD